MTTTAKPLTKDQRAHAQRACKFQHDVDALEGRLVEARLNRDAEIRSLGDLGVRPFVIANETGISTGTIKRALA